MSQQVLKRIVVVSLWSLCVLSSGIGRAHGSPVTISQTGSVVTATNGMLTVTYDLSVGKSNLSAGLTSLISNFYSDYGVSGGSTRISSYDSGTRTGSGVSIGTDGYGTSGEKLTITNSLSSGSTIILNPNALLG